MNDSDWTRFECRQSRLSQLTQILTDTTLKRSDPQYAAVCALLSCDLGDRISLAQLSKRSQVTPQLMMSLLPAEVRAQTSEVDLSSALADILYAGYMSAHNAAVARLFQYDHLHIPGETSFSTIDGLSNEVVERLERVRPQTFGEARRVPGLTPAALSTLLVFLSARRRPA